MKDQPDHADDQSYAVMAKYYDGAYGSKPDLLDLPFYCGLAERTGGPVLEIACGTGRVLLEIARRGIEISGIDVSDDQLKVLAAKLAREPEQVRRRVHISNADMRNFRLGCSFPLVIIPFRPLQHLYTVGDQVRALETARAHLAPGGLLAFDVFFPDFSRLLEPSLGEHLELEWNDPDDAGVVIRRYFRRTAVDFVHQYFEAELVYRTFRGSEMIREERAPLKMGYYTYPHLLLLFRLCGLEVVEEYGGFRKEPIEARRDMVFILRASGEK